MFKCQNCKKKFKESDKAYFNKKEVCQVCYKKLREEWKTKDNEEKRILKRKRINKSNKK